jgi:hypothetical protein
MVFVGKPTQITARKNERRDFVLFELFIEFVLRKKSDESVFF